MNCRKILEQRRKWCARAAALSRSPARPQNSKYRASLMAWQVALCFHTRDLSSCERGEQSRAPKWTLPLLLLIWHSHAIFQGGNSSEALPSTRGALKAISPQSSGWNPLQLNNFLHLVSTTHPATPTTPRLHHHPAFRWHQAPPLRGWLLLPEHWWGATTTALSRDLIWN